MKSPVNTPCIVCDSSSSTLLHEIDYARFGYPGLFAIRQCVGCGLVFNSPRLSDPEIVQLYDGNYYIFQEPEAEAIERVGALLHRTLGTQFAQVPRMQVLEIGCAKGYLLAMLKSLGWAVSGVELSSDAAQYAREVFDLPVQVGTIQHHVAQADFKPQPVVLSTDVIEHVTDVDSFLQACFQAVAPGGLLVLGTPNANSIHRESQGPRWLGFNPFHIVLFSQETLGALLRRHGFELVQAYTYNNTDEAPPMMPADSPVKQALRGVLQRSGLMNAARRLRDGGGHGQAPDAAAVTAQVQAKAQALQQWPAYFNSDDGCHPRRERCQGDNLVMVARRPLNTPPGGAA